MPLGRYHRPVSNFQRLNRFITSRVVVIFPQAEGCTLRGGGVRTKVLVPGSAGAHSQKGITDVQGRIFSSSSHPAQMKYGHPEVLSCRRRGRRARLCAGK